jgi:hypothetical protein
MSQPVGTEGGNEAREAPTRITSPFAAPPGRKAARTS